MQVPCEGYAPPSQWPAGPAGQQLAPSQQRQPPQPQQPASSQLTAEQRARIEHNRQEALRRQNERQRASVLSAPPSHTATADSASSRPATALRGVFMTHAGPPGPSSHQSQQLLGGWQQPAASAIPSAQQYSQQSQQPLGAHGMTDIQAAQSLPPALPCAVPFRSGPTAAPMPSFSSAQPAQMTSTRPPSRGFMFTPPPGLLLGNTGTAGSLPPSALQQELQQPGSSGALGQDAVFVRKRSDASTAAPSTGQPAWVCGSMPLSSGSLGTQPDAAGSMLSSGPDQWQTGAVNPGGGWGALAGNTAIGATTQQGTPQPDSGAAGNQQRRQGQKVQPQTASQRGGGSGSRGSRAAGSNISWSFDPTPQPQKNLTQSTLQQALSRHRKAAAGKHQRQQLDEQQEQEQEPPGVAAVPPELPSQQQQPLAGNQWSTPEPASRGPGHTLAQYTPVNSASGSAPLEGARVGWGRQAMPQRRLLPPLHPGTAPSSSIIRLPLLQPQKMPLHNIQSPHTSSLPPLPAAGNPPAAAAAKPPCNSAWQAQRVGFGAVQQQPAASASTSGVTKWAPSPTGRRDRQPLAAQQGPEARRLKLQHLLCADADPFVLAASAGRRWEWLREPRDAQGRPPTHPDHDPTTLHIPASAWGTELKGADQQYWRIKQHCAHLVLFFQEGNFYHLKDRDADIGMRVGLAAMGGARGSAANMWTVGCNTSAFNEWAAKVLNLGYAVGRVDEDRRGQREPGSTRIRRTLRQVYSPGTLLDESMADACGGSQPLMTLYEGEGLRFGSCIVDVQAATISFASWQESDLQRSILRALLLTTDPAEVGFARGQLDPETRKLLRSLDPVGGGGGGSSSSSSSSAAGGAAGTSRAVMLTHIQYLLPCDPEDPHCAEEMIEHTAEMFLTHRGKADTFAAASQQMTPLAAAAFQLAIQHLLTTQTAQHVLQPCTLVCLDAGLAGGAQTSGHMLLDACAIRSLELLTNSEGGVQGSLLHLLDRAATPAGRRKVRQFISNPLYRVGDIEERLRTTELFMQHPQAADAFQAGMHSAPDCERLLARAANVLAAVVEKVVAAEEADEFDGAAQQAQQAQQAQHGGVGSNHHHNQQQHPQPGTMWGGRPSSAAGQASSSRWSLTGASNQPQRQQQQAAAVSRWAGPNRRPPTAAELRAEAAPRVEQLASVLDLSQKTFLPVVQLLEGSGMLLSALHGLHSSVLVASTGLPVRPGTAAAAGSHAPPLPPPLQRAVAAGEAVATVLHRLARVFDGERFSDAAADIALEQGLCAEYDAARALQESLSAEAATAVAGIQERLQGQGHPAAVLKKVRLAQFRGEELLEVPTAVRGDLEASVPGCQLVKEAQTVAKYRVAQVAATLESLATAREGARLRVLQFLADSAQLFLDHCDAFRALFTALSTLDALAGFAVATHPSAAPAGCAFSRPSFVATVAVGREGRAPGTGAGSSAKPIPPLKLQGLWNPCLLASLAGEGAIQPNDVCLGGTAGCQPGIAGCQRGIIERQPGMLLLTGPNTGGKSTLLRATCLAAVMAQIGCYVPCSAAELAPVDRVFTRIGAQDRMFRGESTFAVEMLETASLLHHSTPASLVVLDELGRGTATHDGHAIAFGVALFLAREKGCRSLFATHHHALCGDRSLLPLVHLAHMQAEVDPRRGVLLPSYRLAPGPAPNGSCGIQVAAACRLPAAVIQRASHMAQQAERDGGARAALQPAPEVGSDGSPARRSLSPITHQAVSPVLHATKKRRMDQPPAAKQGLAAAGGLLSEQSALAGERLTALAAVRAAVVAGMQSVPGAQQQLVQLQAAVRQAFACGKL